MTTLKQSINLLETPQSNKLLSLKHIAILWVVSAMCIGLSARSWGPSETVITEVPTNSLVSTFPVAKKDIPKILTVLKAIDSHQVEGLQIERLQFDERTNTLDIIGSSLGVVPVLQLLSRNHLYSNYFTFVNREVDNRFNFTCRVAF